MNSNLLVDALKFMKTHGASSMDITINGEHYVIGNVIQNGKVQTADVDAPDKEWSEIPKGLAAHEKKIREAGGFDGKLHNIVHGKPHVAGSDPELDAFVRETMDELRAQEVCPERHPLFETSSTDDDFCIDLRETVGDEYDDTPIEPDDDDDDCRVILDSEAVDRKVTEQRVLFKTALCKAFEESGCCKRGDDCLFAHGEAELRARPVRPEAPPREIPRNAKTRLCSNFAKGHCRFGNRCNFAHGKDELRRP